MTDHVGSSARRIVVRAVLLLVPVVALGVAAPWVMDHLRPSARKVAEPRPDRSPTNQEIRDSRRADESLADAEKAWEGSASIAARDAVVDASGERVRWFQGFGLSVESVPPGATVQVNGQERGQTPLTTSVQCKQGDPVQVEVRKEGLRAQARSTKCREDQLVEMSFELR